MDTVLFPLISTQFRTRCGVRAGMVLREKKDPVDRVFFAVLDGLQKPTDAVYNLMYRSDHHPDRLDRQA